MLKEMIEAAVRIPKQAQRLLFQTEELKEESLTEQRIATRCCQSCNERFVNLVPLVLRMIMGTIG